MKQDARKGKHIFQFQNESDKQPVKIKQSNKGYTPLDLILHFLVGKLSVQLYIVSDFSASPIRIFIF